MLYKRLILPLGICMGSQGMRGNKRLYTQQECSLLPLHSSNKGKSQPRLSTKTENKEEEEKEEEFPNYQITDSEENFYDLTAWSTEKTEN